MKLAAIVPVGPLDSMGYQYNSELVLRNLCHYFDYVLVASNTRRTKKIDIQDPKIKFFSSEDYWDPLINGVEKLNIENEVTTKLLAEARKLDADFVVNVSINQYIDGLNFDRLKLYCEELLQNNTPWGWLYKAYQVEMEVTYPSIKLPWVLSVRDSGDMRFIPDGLVYRGEVIRHQNGFYDSAPFFLFDLFCEFNIYDLSSKRAFLAGTDWDVGPKVFENEVTHEVLSYFQRKLSTKVKNKNYKLSDWGMSAYKNYPFDSMVSKLKKSYTPYWKAKLIKIISNIRKIKLT